jgi:hypothetical protein
MGKQRIFLLLLLFLTFASCLPFDVLQHTNNEKPQASAVTDPTSMYLLQWYQSNERGSPTITHHLLGQLYCGDGNTLYDGSYTLCLNSISNLRNATSAITGSSLPLATVFNFDDECISICYTASQVVDYSWHTKTSASYICTYPLDLSITTVVPTFTINVRRTYSGGTGYSSFSALDDTYPAWYIYSVFKPIFFINSSVYNIDNTFLSIYDRYNNAWVNYSINEAILNNPIYKARLYDANFNRILYEDSTWMNFTYQRTLTPVNDLNLINNAPEPITFRFMSQYNTEPIPPIDPSDVVFYPNADSSPLTFTPTPSGTHWSTIDDNMITSDYITRPSSTSVTDTFDMTTTTTNRESFTINSFKVGLYGQRVGGLGGSMYTYINYDGTWDQVSYDSTLFPGITWVWESYTLSGPFTVTQVQLDALQFRIYFLSSGTTNYNIASANVTVNWEFEGVEGIETTSYDEALYTITEDVSPFSSEPFSRSWCTDAYYYDVVDIYDNSLVSMTALESTKTITYTPPNYKPTLISIADNRGDYLPWENFILKVNDTQIYSNSFYGELNEAYNLSIYTRFDKYITSDILTINRTNNYVGFTITLLSLKIYNQQSEFLHVNITFNPAYYVSSQCWSEWIAPGEIVEYRLVAQHYKVNITEYETDSEQIYYYTIQGDDVILVSSMASLYTIYLNVLNVNETIGNQITAVELNITNQNMNINNSIISIVINLDNTNSTIGNLLFNQQTTIENLNSSLDTVFFDQNNSFLFLNSSVISLYAMQTNSFVFLNSSLLTLATYALNSLSFLNSSVENIGIYLMQNFTMLNSTINSSLTSILSNFAILNSNITNNSLEIISRIIALNNSFDSMLSAITTNVLLLNDSIYTAISNISVNFAIDSSLILGNLTVTYQQNEFLTALFKKTLFSEMINWTLSEGYNTTFIESQLKPIAFLNNYNNQTVVIMLKYLDSTEELELTPQTAITRYLPIDHVKYRIKNLTDGEYLTVWKDIESTNITIGSTTEINPATAQDVQWAIQEYLLMGLFGIVIVAVVVILYIKTKAELDAPEVKKAIDTGLEQVGVRDTTHLYFPTRGTIK